MRVSASKLKTWISCPLQARFRYIDRIHKEGTNAYAAFGSCVHHALENYNTYGNVTDAVDVFCDVWDNPAKIDSAIEAWPPGINYSGALQRGKNMIRGYHEKQQWETRTVLAAEHKFLVPFGSYEMQGVVDLVELKQSGKGQRTVRVIDFKTSRKAPSRDTLRLDVQFTAYDYAARQKEFWVGNGKEFPALDNGEYWWEMLKDLPTRTFWYHLEGQKDIDAGARDEQDYMRLYRVCQMMERAEQHNVFVPNISGESCTYCPYTKECGLPVAEFDNDPDEWV